MSDLDLIDLDYEDAEPVQLDIKQIVRRGARLRRDRLITRAAAVAVVFGLVPAAVAINASRQHPVSFAGTSGTESGGHGAVRRQAANAPVASGIAGPVRRYPFPVGPNAPGVYAGAGGAINGLAQPAAVRQAVTLPARYGPVRGLTPDWSGQGAWFWDSTARQVLVFHLSATGKLASWPVPRPVRRLAAGPSGQAAVALLGSPGVLILSARRGKIRLVPGESFGAAPYYGLLQRCTGSGYCAPGRRAPGQAPDLWVASQRTVMLLSLPDRPRFLGPREG